MKARRTVSLETLFNQHPENLPLDWGKIEGFSYRYFVHCCDKKIYLRTCLTPNHMKALSAVWGLRKDVITEADTNHALDNVSGYDLSKYGILDSPYFYRDHNCDPLPWEVKGGQNLFEMAAYNFANDIIFYGNPAKSAYTPFQNWAISAFREEGIMRVFMACLVWLGQLHSRALPLFPSSSVIYNARGSFKFHANDGGGWLGTLIYKANKRIEEYFGIDAYTLSALAASWCAGPDVWYDHFSIKSSGYDVIRFRFDVLCHYPFVLYYFDVPTRTPKKGVENPDENMQYTNY